MKNKVPSYEEAKRIVGLDKNITTCPLCERGYLLEEEREHINETGICWSCETKGTLSREMADMPITAINGSFCSECGAELDVILDENDELDGFQILPYVYCPVCKERVMSGNNKDYFNYLSERN